MQMVSSFRDYNYLETMKSKVLLRIAAAFILVHLLGHGMGHSAWDKPEDPRMQEVVAAMKGYSAEFMGATKSMADYYHGYSLIIFGLYAMTILILWFASGFINEQRSIAVRILWPVAVTYLAFGVIEYISFFPFAAAMSFFAGLFTLLAITVAKR
jgi:hypothetical protein